MSEHRKITVADRRKTLGRAKPDVMMPAPDTIAGMPEGYPVFLSGIKEIIARERIKAVTSANVAMVLMYWDIGQVILQRQQWEGWGARVIDRLSPKPPEKPLDVSMGRKGRPPSRLDACEAATTSRLYREVRM